MYRHHFGLQTAPFRITPDTDRFYAGGRRGALLAALEYALLDGEGILKVTGEVGSGKTMLCRMLERRLRDRVELVYLANPSLSPDEVLRSIAAELGHPAAQGSDRLAVLHWIQQHLLQACAAGRRVVALVEEAQAMPLESLEQIRYLANLETGHDRLFQVVLFGQPELDQRLTAPAIRQLRERITHGFRLRPLTPAETADYLAFRLRSAGYAGNGLFSPAATRLLARRARGLLRRVNILAEKALLAAYTESASQVTRHHVRCALHDAEFARPTWPPARLVPALSLGLLALVLGLSGYAVTRHLLPPVAAPRMPLAQAEPGVPGPSLLQRRLMATRSWLASHPQARYTVQMMLSDSDDPAAVERFLASDRLRPLRNRLFVYRTLVGGRPRWAVIYGGFRKASEGRAALAALPASLRANRPYLRSLQPIRRRVLTPRLAMEG